MVTGQDGTGRSLVVSDEEVEPVRLRLMPGTEFHRLWGSDAAPTLPTDGTAPRAPGYFPTGAGYRFAFLTLPPHSDRLPADIDVAAAIEEIQATLPGLLEAMEPEHPGMHTTDTVDAALVTAGEVVLELDDGVEVDLYAGDCVIQNGTRHAWHNRSDQPAVIFCALLGAQRVR